MPPVEIRAYENADHDDVVQLWRLVFPNAPARNDPVLNIRRKLQAGPELFLVASVDSRVVGTTMAGFDGHRGWLHLIAVAPEQRRQGIGSEMIREAEDRLAALGCPKVNLQVRASSPEAVGFYQRLGYAVEERISMGKVLA